MAKDSGIKVPNQGWDMLRPTEEANIGQKSVIYHTKEQFQNEASHTSWSGVNTHRNIYNYLY